VTYLLAVRRLTSEASSQQPAVETRSATVVLLRLQSTDSVRSLFTTICGLSVSTVRQTIDSSQHLCGTVARTKGRGRPSGRWIGWTTKWTGLNRVDVVLTTQTRLVSLQSWITSSNVACLFSVTSPGCFVLSMSIALYALRLTRLSAVFQTDHGNVVQVVLRNVGWTISVTTANLITEVLRYGTRCTFKGSHSITCHPRVYPRTV